jgi:hypothetical protein
MASLRPVSAHLVLNASGHATVLLSPLHGRALASVDGVEFFPRQGSKRLAGQVPLPGDVRRPSRFRAPLLRRPFDERIPSAFGSDVPTSGFLVLAHSKLGLSCTPLSRSCSRNVCRLYLLLDAFPQLGIRSAALHLLVGVDIVHTTRSFALVYVHREHI